MLIYLFAPLVGLFNLKLVVLFCLSNLCICNFESKTKATTKITDAIVRPTNTPNRPIHTVKDS
jgi:hypothetical protein